MDGLSTKSKTTSRCDPQSSEVRKLLSALAKDRKEALKGLGRDSRDDDKINKAHSANQHGHKEVVDAQRKSDKSISNVSHQFIGLSAELYETKPTSLTNPELEIPHNGS
eukprot:CAMPEP_0113716712 /NCGR_PEP_ID=MMETSP0038_2-20120614/34068_1 /TAXON_ID=2898 /ORGANISM="Cryptomonas paramecium" /LENGTH=108 /DNA_ID=CAMNT_0000644317 /DNA_START=48 /DNA_END=370 /DNA_ORIENTATION=- /assembly_acc=CAM_ASM_000170